MYYRFYWHEGDTSTWFGPFNSGDTCVTTRVWGAPGFYNLKVKAKDQWDFESDWSDPLSVAIYDYVAGDADGSSTVNILDVTFVINYLYKGGPAPAPAEAGDANGNSTVNLLDVTYLINHLYKGGPPPVYS